MGFDISNAFIRSTLEDSDRVFVRLPQHWSADPRGDRARLLKSLYGLRCAPRKWYDCYSKYLLSDGWKRSPQEPGLFKKGKLTLAIYVDDSFITGPDQQECVAACKRILDRFSGKMIPPIVHGGIIHERDILGVRMLYNRETRCLTLDLQAAIEKLAKKFDIQEGRPLATPCVYTDLEEGRLMPEYPLRKLIGGLQYIGTMCRPDVVFAINRVARAQNKPTASVITAAKRIVRYLLQTKGEGLRYTPQREAQFRETYRKVLEEQGSKKSLPDLVAFSDADFAGCSVTLRSSSGSILHFRGMPICWSSKRQTLRAYSTCESEYIALFDTLKLTQGQGFLEWLDENQELPGILFTDNKSAIEVAKSSLPTKKTKHFLLRWHEVKEHMENIAHVPTDKNKADPLTKPMANPLLCFFALSREPLPEKKDGIAALYSAAVLA